MSFPTSPKDTPWNDIEIGSHLNADEYHIACRDDDASALDTRCTAILLYGRHVVYFNMWTMRNGIEYISIQDMESLFIEIDAILSI